MNFDVIHCHDFRMFFLGCRIKKKNPNLALIYDSHEYLAGYPYYQRSKKLSNRLKGFVIWNYYYYKEQIDLKKADYIITVSTSLKDFLVNKSGRPGIVLRNLPPVINKCVDNCNYWHQKFNLPPDKKIVIHTGNAHFSNERLLFLLECIDEDPNLALVFLGSNKSVDEIKNVVEINDFKDTFFHENVDRAHITHYCSQADIGLVYTWNKKWKSYWYALPNKMMDVSLSGIPVLSTEQPELKKFINIFRHGVTFNGDSKSSLKEAIEKIIESYDLFKENANEIEEQLNWQLESKKLIDLYKTDLIS
jgi:glycosyltransferase involved in cell wall biosynthesis